jgi:transposase-like protein
MQTGSFEKVAGTVDVDETFVGGLEKNKHADKKLKAGRGGVGKTLVLGILNRAENANKISKIRVKVISDRTQDTLHAEIKANVEEGCEVFTDAHKGYDELSEQFKHDFVDHAFKYVKGRVHTNGVEHFWNLFDRTVRGTYIKPEPQHFSPYIDEQAFRFNHRDGNDLTRFLQVMMRVNGKRLTYAQLTRSHLRNVEPKK